MTKNAEGKSPAIEKCDWIYCGD